MSLVTLRKLGTPPSAPGVDDVTLYIGSDGSLFAIDESGVVTRVGGTGANKAVRNESGATLARGKAVYASGFDSGTGLTLVALADKDDAAKRPAIGIVKDDIPNNSNGELAIISTVVNVDTSAFALTDQLVLGNAVALIRPPPENSPFTGKVQNVAVVSKVGATDGEITALIDGLEHITAPQIFALAGTDGAPGPANKYVTDSDPRLAGTSFDQRDVAVWEHWVTGNLTTDRAGLMGWRLAAAGTGNAQSIIAEVGHPGIVTATAAGRSALYLGGEAGLNNFLLSAGQNTITSEWLVRFDAASLLAANNERVTFGFGDDFESAAGTEHTNGVYCEFNPATSANFLLRTAAAATRSQVITTIPVVAGNWYRIEIRVTYPGGVPTAEILINGVSRGTLTTNFPAAVTGIGLRADANIGAGYNFDNDYVLVKQVSTKET